MELTNIGCLITGSTGTLGGAIAMALARAGADCVCHYHTRADRAGQLAGDIVRLGRRAMVLQADLRNPEQIDELFEKASGFGPIQVLVNSAAVFGRRKLGEITPQSIREILDMNLAAPLLVSRAFVKKSAGQTGGAASVNQVRAKIINIADIGGLHPWAEYAEYCASKAGLIAMTQSLAKELAPAITVNAVAPGIVTWPESLDEQHKQKAISRIPLGRFALPEEVAEAVVFLARHDYITGQVLQIDGGWRI
jgi:NAD(P)-dependent dehydrogenase (short-subunit alcohol dehydrogenase family)